MTLLFLALAQPLPPESPWVPCQHDLQGKEVEIVWGSCPWLYTFLPGGIVLERQPGELEPSWVGHWHLAGHVLTVTEWPLGSESLTTWDLDFLTGQATTKPPRGAAPPCVPPWQPTRIPFQMRRPP